MNAICGVIDRAGRELLPGRIESGLQAMAAYGHDGKGSWIAGHVALAQQTTRVLPEDDSEPGPYRYDGDALVLVGDVRLDNREELLDLLTGAAHERTTSSDARLVLLAYRRWGRDCPERLAGDFSFALWDADLRRLLCARDVAGARPFYYADADGQFLFASDIDAALQLLGRRRLDPGYVKGWLRYGLFAPPERTFYRSLHKLPPAHAMSIDAGGVRLWRYWDPETLPEVRYRSESDYVGRLRELIEASVACRLRSVTRVAAHASGGLDSSTVAVLAARASADRGKKLPAISWAPPPAAGEVVQDERALLQELEASESLAVTYTPTTPSMLLEEWATDVTLHPVQTLVFERQAARIAASAGIGVVLSGWGGDEFAAFNGRGYTADLFVRGRWLKLARELRHRSRLFPGQSMWGVRRRIVGPLLPDWVVRRWARSQGTVEMGISRALAPDFTELLRCSPDLEWEQGRERRGVRNNQLRLLRMGHLPLRMESWFDFGSRHRVEYRYPLLDRRIMEFALGIPDDLFFRNGWKRYLFRAAAEGILPDSARWNKRKIDPAAESSLRSAFTPALPLFLQRLADQRERVEAGGFLSFDQLMRDIEGTGADALHRVSAMRAVFLAFLHPKTTL